MPCKDWEDDCRYPHYSENHVNELQVRIDELTRMLCEATHYLYAGGVIEHTSIELQSWFHAHEKMDEKRLMSEVKKLNSADELKFFLENLSDKEKHILGLNK